MNLFRRYTLPVAHDKPLAETCRRIASAARAAGQTSVRARFYLGDRIDLKTSGVDRAIERFPWVAPLVITGEHRKALSNLDARFEEGNPAHDAPIDADRIAELLDAVPRPCPFGLCLLVFDDLPFLAPADFRVIPPFRKRARSVHIPNSTSAFHADAAPEITLSARMASNKVKQQALTATIAMPRVTADARTLPPLDPAAAAALDAIGKRSHEELLVQSEVADRDRIAATNGLVGQISQRWDAQREDVTRRLALPHPDLPLERGPHVHGYTPGPLKPTLIDTFGPRGYRYRPRASGRGNYRLAKPTVRNNRLTLELDVGPISHEMSCRLDVEGWTWSHHLTVGCAAGRPAKGGYHVRSDEMMRQMVANAAVIVDYLEREVVPTIEEARDAPPAWWKFPA